MKHMPQRGLSTIELLVALAISSFLILGITQVYLDSKRNYLYQQNQANNQESGRFATLLINEYLSRAGYRRAPEQLMETAFPARAADTDCMAFLAGSAVTAARSDIGVCLRYQPMRSGELDCQGSASAAFTDTQAFTAAPLASTITMVLKYVPGTGTNLHQGQLQCKSLSAPAPAYVELLSGIADLRMEFGLTKDSSSLEKEIRTYVTSSSWTTAQGAIRSVRYSMLLSSNERQRDGGDTQVLTDWLATAPAANKTRLQGGDKNRIYQVAGSTQIIRNLMP